MVVVLSGSMEPSMFRGDILVLLKKEDLAIYTNDKKSFLSIVSKAFFHVYTLQIEGVRIHKFESTFH